MSKLNANATEWRPGSSGNGNGPEFTLPASTNEMDVTSSTSGNNNNNRAYTSQSVSQTCTAANTPALTALNTNLTHTPQLSMNNNNNSATNVNCNDSNAANSSTSAAAAAMMTMMMNNNNSQMNNNYNFANPMNMNPANMPNMMMPMGMMPNTNMSMPSLMPMMMIQPQHSTIPNPAMYMPQPFAMPMNTPMMGLTSSSPSPVGGNNFAMPQSQGMTPMPMMPNMMMNVNPNVMPEYYPTFMTINKSIKVDSENVPQVNAESNKEGKKNSSKTDKDQAADSNAKNKDSSTSSNSTINVTFGEMNWKVEFDKVIKLTEELIEQQISGVAEEATQKKVAQEIFNTPAATLVNDSNINNNNQSGNKNELGVLSQIAPNSISAAMSAANNIINNNGQSSISQDNTMTHVKDSNKSNIAVSSNTSTIKSTEHTPLISAQQQQQQNQKTPLPLQPNQTPSSTPNTTFTPEIKSSTNVLLPSQHEKIEK